MSPSANPSEVPSLVPSMSSSSKPSVEPSSSSRLPSIQAKYPERSQEAQDLEGYILQDQKDLDAQLDNLKYIYAETIQEATSNHIPLSTLTGDAAKDF